MRRLTMGLLVLFAFAVPWEHSLDLGSGLGDVARILGLLVLLAAMPALIQRKSIKIPRPLQWFSLAFFLYFASSYLWSVDPDVTIEKIRSYFQVMVTVWTVLEFAQTPGDLVGLLRAFVIGCWVLAILTFQNFSSADAIAVQIRFAASGQDPNDVARVLDLGFPLAALLCTNERSTALRLLALGYLPVGLAAVILTASRGGFSASLIALAGSAMILTFGRPKAGIAIVVGLVAFAGVAWLFVPAESLDRLMTIPDQVGSGDLNDRFSIWVSGWHAFVRAPWFGYGAGAYATASRLAPEDTAHNTAMAVLVTGGILGLAIFVAILVPVVLGALSTKGTLRIALVTVVTVWAVTAMVGSVEENRTTWLLFALVALAARLNREAPEALGVVFPNRRTSEGRWTIELAGRAVGKPTVSATTSVSSKSKIASGPTQFQAEI